MINQIQQQVTIKGIREGLLIIVDGNGSYDNVWQQLQTELSQKRAFLAGSQVALQVGKRPLQKSQLLHIQTLMAQHKLELWAVLTEEKSTRDAARELDLATRLAGSHTDLEGNALPAVEASQIIQGHDDTPSGLILKETLRSGRSVYHEGHVVVIGDVNPGAEIIAGGDVIVWGRLRGLVHAGALGDETAVICALELNPTQLRIGDKIAISPENEKRNQPEPEQAAVRSGQIVAERWQTKN